MAKFTQNQIHVINALRTDNTPKFALDIANALGADVIPSGEKGVTALMTGLVKGGYVQKSEGKAKRINKEGAEVERTLKMYSLTELGLSEELELK